MRKGACVKGGCFQGVGPGRQGTVRMAVVIIAKLCVWLKRCDTSKAFHNAISQPRGKTEKCATW